MTNNILYATGFFEVGDTFFDEHGQQHLITDVMLCHYIKSGTYRVFYEVDNSGEFVDLVMKGFEEFPATKQKPELRVINFPKNSEKR